MIVERDVRVPTRFGYDVFVDIFRPADDALRVPPLIGWTPYGKHDPAPLAKIYPASGVESEWISDYTIFEAPDPAYWVPKGYAIITADVPGTWHATTDARYCAPEEAQAFYDLIEWAGVQAWSNGKVGLSGVSYLTVMQWRVAELNPPHLAAINPWEGWSDTYREVTYHGGIPETYFWPYIQVRWGASDRQVEDLWRETLEHPLFDDFWASKAAQLEKIEVPAYVVASWSDHGLHTRGTLEGFKKISSSQKWLEVHGRKKWHWYYEPGSVRRQRAFFDHFLKGLDTGLASWPKVKLEVRSGCNVGSFEATTHWPVPDTQYERLYLDARTRSLTTSLPQTQSDSTYESLSDEGRAVFDYRFSEAADLVGHMKLKLHVAAESADDLDLFVAIEKLDHTGQTVPFVHYAVFEQGPVALGWLRVSHRELDETSTEYQPILKHRSVLKVKPGEIVSVEIEILPTGTHFEAGSTLRLVIRGRDIYSFPKPMLYIHHEDTVNRGQHRVYAGAETDSYLLIPRVRLQRQVLDFRRNTTTGIT
jgi:predicted acyl esterase